MFFRLKVLENIVERIESTHKPMTRMSVKCSRSFGL